MVEPNQKEALPFLDTLVSSGPNNTLITTVYRKLTHRDQYLHWDSNHFITAKNSVFNTLAYRAKVDSTNQQAFHKEMEYIRTALQACFPPWALNIVHNKFNCKHNIHNGQTSIDNQPKNNNNTANKNNITIVVPYIHGLGEKVQKDMQQYGHLGTFQGYQHYKNPPHGPKDKDSKLQKKWSYL